MQTQIRLLLEEQSDQGLHCLLFHLHLFDEIPEGFASLLKILGRLQQKFLVSENLGTLQYFHFRSSRSNISFFDGIHVSKQNSTRLDALYCGFSSGAVLFAYIPYKGC